MDAWSRASLGVCPLGGESGGGPPNQCLPFWGQGGQQQANGGVLLCVRRTVDSKKRSFEETSQLEQEAAMEPEDFVAATKAFQDAFADQDRNTNEMFH